MQQRTPRSFGTHNGTFHADEVTACALLLLYDLIDEDKIHRSRDLEVLKHCDFVCDVGGLYSPAERIFDHHQADYQGPLSSAGMVLLDLMERSILPEEEYIYLRRALIDGVDAHDNGQMPALPGVCTFSAVISNFTPISHEAEGPQQDSAFLEAVHFALGHLKRLIERHRYQLGCRESVAIAMRQGVHHLEFDRPLPWLEAFFEMGGEQHPALFVLMPAGAHWKLRGIPPNLERRMDVRKPLPASWAGLLDEELQQISGISGSIFCHKGRFISVWKTREDALKALKVVIEMP